MFGNPCKLYCLTDIKGWQICKNEGYGSAQHSHDENWKTRTGKSNAEIKARNLSQSVGNFAENLSTQKADYKINI